MIHAPLARRVTGPTGAGTEYVAENNCKKKRRRDPGQGHRRQNPSNASTLLRGNTLSVPAHVPAENAAHRHLSEGVTHPEKTRDLPMILASAAANPAVSDRALRVFTVVVTQAAREVSAEGVAATLPSLTKGQAARLLGDLVTAGLLTKRLRTVGYKDGKRVRAGAYSLRGGAL